MGAGREPTGPGRGGRGGPGGGSPLPRPAARPRPLSSAAAQVGARRGAHVGRRATGARRARGAQPPPHPSPGAGAAPPDERPRLPRLWWLRRLRRSPAARRSAPLLASSRVAAGAAGIAVAASPGAARRGGAEGGAGVWGEGGEGAGRRGREGASEQAGHFCAARVRLGARPGGRRTHGLRTDSARKPRRRCQVSRPRHPRPGPGDPAASPLACVCVCEGSRLGLPSSSIDRPAGRLWGAGHPPGGGRGAGVPARSPGSGSVRLRTGAGMCGVVHISGCWM